MGSLAAIWLGFEGGLREEAVGVYKRGKTRAIACETIRIRLGFGVRVRFGVRVLHGVEKEVTGGVRLAVGERGSWAMGRCLLRARVG